MAKVINGLIVGKVGNLVYYIQDGRQCLRSLPIKNNRLPTLKELNCRNNMKLAQDFLGRMLAFLRIGFAEIAGQKKDKPYNQAVSALIKNAITGTYPDRTVDPALVVVAKGNLRLPVDAGMTLVGNELVFTWNATLEKAWPHANDRVMLLAYEEEDRDCIYNLAGVQRRVGTDRLTVSNSWMGKRIQTYLAFRSESGALCSDSVYTGSVVL